MTDPFRGELTATYVERENLRWAESERVARSVRSRRASLPILRRIARPVLGLFAPRATFQSADGHNRQEAPRRASGHLRPTHRAAH